MHCTVAAARDSRPKQMFGLSLVLNTEKLNPSQGQKKQFNLDKSINRVAICLSAARMRL